MPELKKYKMFIGGEWVDSDTKKTFETLNPEDNKPWAIVPEASANETMQNYLARLKRLILESYSEKPTNKQTISQNIMTITLVWLIKLKVLFFQ